MRDAGVALRERADWDPIRRAPDDFDRAPLAHKEELIEPDPAWGQIVCRCETVPEAEWFLSKPRGGDSGPRAGV